MRYITTEFLRNNPTGTACGLIDNKSLSSPIVLHLIDTYFGGEIFANDSPLLDIDEIKATVKHFMTRDELDILCNDKNLKRWLKEILDCKIKNINIEDKYVNQDVIGTIFDYYVNEAHGSARYDGVHDGILIFEVE